jgi:hypothetical protein
LLQVELGLREAEGFLSFVRAVVYGERRAS